MRKPTLLLLFLLPTAQAQQPTLDQILQQLETNLTHYDTHIPSFFADEHVISQVSPGTRGQNTITDSIFRLKRTSHPDHTSTLDESRDIKSVNGRPPSSHELTGPTVISGAFEGGLALVSLSQSACTKFTLEHTKHQNPTSPYIIRFASVLTSRDSSTCMLNESSKGRVFIDPASMQITHLELITPHHAIIPGDAWSSPLTGRRVLTVDYTPIALNGETFWMPSTIAADSTSGAGTFHQIAWHFKATYRNFHKLEVTSHILPPSEPTASIP